MPKVKKHNRSPLQERIIVAAMFIETLIGKGGLFNAKAINQVLGGRLTEYRKTEIERMAKSGWFKCDTPLGNGEKFYMLTNIARSQILIEYQIKESDYLLPDEYGIYNNTEFDNVGF